MLDKSTTLLRATEDEIDRVNNHLKRIVVSRGSYTQGLTLSVSSVNEVPKPQTNAFTYLMVDLHINRKLSILARDDFQGTKFF